MSLAATIAIHPAVSPATEPKVELLTGLKRAGYSFVTTSVASHKRVLRRSEGASAGGLRDIFGWSRPFAPEVLRPQLLEIMQRSDLLRPAGRLLCSTVRVSSLGQYLLLHSAFPTSAPDAVFFGPDTYRFASFLREELKGAPSRGVVFDVGTGSGAGAIVAARHGDPHHLVLGDTNPRALELARANLRAAGIVGDVVLSDGLEGFPGDADLIVANPPFIAGFGGHPYRDGGGLHGAEVPLAWALAAVDRLKPGGRLLLYTGSAIVEGEDRFLTELKAALPGQSFRLGYREIDPDIFGGLLASDAYADVDRIAAVGLSVTRL